MGVSDGINEGVGLCVGDGESEGVGASESL